jgi:hypothetical protein
MTLLLRAMRNFIPAIAVLFCGLSYSQGMGMGPEMDAELLTENNLIGTAIYGVAFWDTYELSFYSDQNPFVEGEPPYALRIGFLKDYGSTEFVDRLISQLRVNLEDDEMRLAQWHSRLLSFFPDVENGTVINAVYTQDRQTHFYSGGDYLGLMRDPQFGRRLIGIWVSPRGAESKARNQLLGIGNTAN